MENQDFEGKYGITIAEAVVVIGVCERKVRGLIADGKIPHYRIGCSVRIPWPELKTWLRNGGTEGGHNGGSGTNRRITETNQGKV
ncbi:MAG: excisionase family DNA-binding protein [Phycisphaerae bacterium]|jgi:excisionase family DNA binding protein|nr:excisionase family DNA-binding protein [Phycisphaerae bacterium]